MLETILVTSKLYNVKNIEIAEAAKSIENTQRDINIGLMNEFSIICDKLNIKTKDVIDAAATKWNFNNFLSWFGWRTLYMLIHYLSISHKIKLYSQNN